MATILVIDDDPDVTQLIQFALTRAGHQILTAKDGQAGLDITLAEHPDLVIADVMMPKLNGYEYCRRVRAQEELADIPILVFSARFQAIDQQTALQAGATDYMPKTVEPSELVQHVEKLLRESPAAPKSSPGQIVAFFSLRGGVGVTSLAVNLSVTVALSRKQQIALIDMAPLAGHVALMLSLRPTGSLRKALGTNGEFSPESLKPHWQAHASGVQVLSSALSPSDAGEVPADSIDSLAASLRQEFPLAVLDLPPVLNKTTTTALITADRVILVVTPDVASIQSAAVALQVLNAIGVENGRVWPVLNTPGGAGGLSPDAVAKALKRSPVAIIPYEPDMLSALNARRPLMQASPRSAAANAIAQLAKQVLE